MIRQSTLALLASAVLVLGACNSSDDDSGGGGGGADGGGADGGADGGGADGGMTDGAPMSGDVLDIAGRDADSESVALDTDALTSQLDTLLGDGDSLEPFTIEGGETAEDALRRGTGVAN